MRRDKGSGSDAFRTAASAARILATVITALVVSLFYADLAHASDTTAETSSSNLPLRGFKEDLWEINTSVRVMKVSWDGGEDTVSFQRSTDRGKKKKLEIGARTSKLRFTAEAVAVGKFEELAIDDHNLFGVLGR